MIQTQMFLKPELLFFEDKLIQNQGLGTKFVLKVVSKTLHIFYDLFGHSAKKFEMFCKKLLPDVRSP